MKKEIIHQLQLHQGKPIGEFMQGYGQWLHPIIHTVSEQGHIVLAIQVREDMLNPFGILHGGALAGMIDEALGFQLFLLSDPDEAFVAVNLQIDFLRATPAGETVLLKPHLVRKGRNLANLTCQVLNSEGKLIAQASSNFAQYHKR
jgi:uncharacterized protein (TIGR00369 family)